MNLTVVFNMFSCAIVTLCIGADFKQMSRLTHPLMRAYSERTGADMVIINKRKLRNLPVHFEKFQIEGILQKYDRVLFVDTDVVIRPSSPNLFDLVPFEKVGVYVASVHSDCHDVSIRQIQKEFDEIGWYKEYFNSGVMLVSKPHVGLFDLSHGSFTGFFEQTQLNYNLQKLNLPVFDLTYRYNHVEAAGISISEGSSYFIHYAGPGHGSGSKYNQIMGAFGDLVKIGNRNKNKIE
jgi:lipopolysaccharide biosynthesis glycosyltransferase